MDKWLAREEDDLKDVFNRRNASAMFSIIRSCLPSGSKHSVNTNRLKDADGNITNTFTESRTVVQNFFFFCFRWRTYATC